MKPLAWCLPVLLAACIPYPHVEVKPEPKYALFTQNAHDPSSDFSARFPLHESPQGAEWARLQQDRFIMRMEALKPSWLDRNRSGPDDLYWMQRSLQQGVLRMDASAFRDSDKPGKCFWSIVSDTSAYLRRPEAGWCREIDATTRQSLLERAEAWNATWRQPLTPVDQCVTQLRGLLRSEIVATPFPAERLPACMRLDPGAREEAMRRADILLPQRDRAQYPLAGRS